MPPSSTLVHLIDERTDNLLPARAFLSLSLFLALSFYLSINLSTFVPPNLPAPPPLPPPPALPPHTTHNTHSTLKKSDRNLEARMLIISSISGLLLLLFHYCYKFSCSVRLCVCVTSAACESGQSFGQRTEKCSLSFFLYCQSITH